MELSAPPVRYTSTSDGYSIAYMSAGEGPAIIFLPQLFQHSLRLWNGGAYSRTLRYLARRFRIIQYDSRGQGMSQRGLSDDHSMAAYEHDLDAVIEASDAESFALCASNQFGHIAIHYALKHPERVQALVLYTTSVDSSYGSLLSDEMVEFGRTNWELFLLLNARAVFPKSDSAGMVSYL